MQSKQAKICEDIHDYLDELDDLLMSCKLNPTIPERAIKSRALVFSEIPKLMEAIETLTQTLASKCEAMDAENRLDSIRALEGVNMALNELLPLRKDFKIVK